MDDSSYSNCDGDKTVVCPSFVSNCLNEQVTFISFMLMTVEGDPSCKK